MILYFIWICIVASVFEFSGYSQKKELIVSDYKLKRDLLYYGIVLYIIIIAGLRADSIGADIDNYKQHFYETYNGKEAIYEPGYELLVRVVQLFTSDFQIFMFICSTISLGCIFFVIYKKTSRYRFVSAFIMILTVYVQSFWIIRTYLALAFLMLAYYMFEENGKKISVVVICYFFTAVLFHYSMLIFIIIYIYIYLGQRINLLFGVIIALLFRSEEIGKLIVALIATVRPRYAGYIEGQVYHTSITYLIIYTFIFMVVMWFDKSNIFCQRFYFFFVFFALAFPWFPAYSRVLSLGLPFFSITLNRILNKEIGYNNRRIVIISSMLVFLVYFLLQFGIEFRYYSNYI